MDADGDSRVFIEAQGVAPGTAELTITQPPGFITPAGRGTVTLTVS